MMWTSVADELEDPRIDKEGELLRAKLTRTRISETLEQYILDGEEARGFVSECVNGDLVACKRRLELSEHSETLVQGKDPRDGKTALSCVCEEGHLEVVDLLCQHGADLESVDNEGLTPIMLATLNGHGKTAYYLAQLGASLFVMDNNGTTVIEMAKTAFQELNELEWSKATIPIYSSGMGSPDGMEQVEKRNAALRRIKERKEGLRHVIDLYMALKPERNIQERALTERKEGNTFSIIQLNETHRPRVLFNKTLFETTMAKENKAFAFLDRGRPFEHIQATAVSGYTAGECGNDDGCLDRSLWTSRVMEYCKVIGHELQRVDQYGRTVSEISQACHAEKQLMAYFLWMHTTLDQDFEDSNDDGEIWGNCYEIGDLGTCKPNVASMKKDIYVSREPCRDCTRFQKRLHEKAGILFNLFFIKPICN
ncbi:hypothetical protein DL95DRAFT_470590 [Leptodontidium sp. 2 PMI_412]|nr:hypothetical protein DL95DRAFT_470590 [Leptodontidium sp. 2 PMI_412]